MIESALDNLGLWWLVYFAAMFFVWAMRAERPVLFVFCTLAFAVCTATAVTQFH